MSKSILPTKITLPTFTETVNKVLSRLVPYYADGNATRVDQSYVYSDQLQKIKVVYSCRQATLELIFNQAVYEINPVCSLTDLYWCLESIVTDWMEDYPKVTSQSREKRDKDIKLMIFPESFNWENL